MAYKISLIPRLKTQHPHVGPQQTVVISKLGSVECFNYAVKFTAFVTETYEEAKSLVVLLCQMDYDNDYFTGQTKEAFTKDCEQFSLCDQFDVIANAEI